MTLPSDRVTTLFGICLSLSPSLYKSQFPRPCLRKSYFSLLIKSKVSSGFVAKQLVNSAALMDFQLPSVFTELSRQPLFQLTHTYLGPAQSQQHCSDLAATLTVAGTPIVGLWAGVAARSTLSKSFKNPSVFLTFCSAALPTGGGDSVWQWARRQSSHLTVISRVSLLPLILLCIFPSTAV